MFAFKYLLILKKYFFVFHFFLMTVLAISLQDTVLQTIDREGIIPDSGLLKLENGDSIDQLALLGVLNGLQSREVSV